ncbi:MAG: hypothetical protein GY730_11335 [bacterium]|nr:hypothetical protein [bacterium]
MAKVDTPPVEDYKNTTILIVEDEMKAVPSYNKYLERNCYNIIVTNSGKEALERLEDTDNINVVVILDVRWEILQVMSLFSP